MASLPRIIPQPQVKSVSQTIFACRSSAAAYNFKSCLWQNDSKSTSFTFTANGRLNSDPIAERTTFGEKTSAVPFRQMMAAAPSASAVRMSVPILPGSCNRSKISRQLFGNIVKSFKEQSFFCTTSIKPCGDFVSLILLKIFSDTS